MRSLLKALMKEANLGFLALIVLVALVWFAGEYFQYDRKLRILAIVVLLAVWLLLYIVQKLLAIRSAMLIEQRLRAQAQDQIAGLRPDKRPEVEALEAQLGEAIQSLKSSKMGKGALHALPWYVIIGPPGAGKTTALLESGLNFPYTSQGRKGIRGVGGTRNCDWWFTDQGILLDTAGRYTTEVDDRDEWLAFLDLLKKCRRRKPINGALVAVSIADLLKASDAELEAHATNIRDRLDELSKRLELVFPVYLVFTKCDLLSGFVDFFDDLAKADRAQIWGTTLPYTPLAGRTYQEVFAEESRKLYASLATHRLSALSKERPEYKKSRVYGFPLQFSLGLGRLGEFVDLVFRPNPFQESPLFRGFYFTSGTQEGLPIDQLLEAMGQAFDLKQEAGELVTQAFEKKSYFLHQVFTKVIFPDQLLARSSTRRERRSRILRRVSLSACGAGFALLLLWTLVSFVGNRILLSSVENSAKKVLELRGAQADLLTQLRSLEGLRQDVATLDGHTRHGVPFRLRAGLYSGKVVDPAARAVYFDRLKALFLDPCDRRIQEELERRRQKADKTTQDYEELYEIYRVYQMLAGGAGTKLDLDEIRRVLSGPGRWVPAPQAGAEAQELGELPWAQLGFYLSQLDRRDAPRFHLDEVLVKRINRELAETLWITESFNDIFTTFKDRLSPVTLDTLLKGPSKPLFLAPKTFSSFYTRDGWSSHVKFAIVEKSRSLSSKYAELRIDMSAGEIEKRLRDQYETRYRDEWRGFLDALQLDPERFNSLEAAQASLDVLKGAQSPYRELIPEVWAVQAARFTEPDLAAAAVGVDFQWLDKALEALSRLKDALTHFVSRTGRGPRFIIEEKVNEKIEDVCTAFQGADDGIAAALSGIADLAQKDRAGKLLRLSLDASRLAMQGESQAEADALWRSKVHTFFLQRAAGKYPFVEGAAEQVALADFSALFNPKNGRVRATQEILKTLAGQAVLGQPLARRSYDFDMAMRRAEAFAAALYETDGDTMAVGLDITLKRGPGVGRVRLSLGNEDFDPYQRPDSRGKLKWLQEKSKGAKLSILPSDNEWRPKDYSAEPWGLFRLVREGRQPPSPGQDERSFSCSWTFQVTIGGTPQTLRVDADIRLEKDNPFAERFFEEFRCPAKVSP